MINNNAALTYTCCITESWFHLFLYRAREKSLCTCAGRVLHGAESEKVIYICPGIVSFTTASSASSNFTLPPTKTPGTHSFTVTSTLTYILLLTGTQGICALSVLLLLFLPHCQ